jgi:hypothetical protein
MKSVVGAAFASLLVSGFARGQTAHAFVTTAGKYTTPGASTKPDLDSVVVEYGRDTAVYAPTQASLGATPWPVRFLGGESVRIANNQAVVAEDGSLLGFTAGQLTVHRVASLDMATLSTQRTRSRSCATANTWLSPFRGRVGSISPRSLVRSSSSGNRTSCWCSTSMRTASQRPSRSYRAKEDNG